MRLFVEELLVREELGLCRKNRVLTIELAERWLLLLLAFVSIEVLSDSFDKVVHVLGDFLVVVKA